MSNEADLVELELSEEKAREQIDMRDAFIRLQNSADFQTVIEKGYFKNEASRLTLLRADKGMQDPNNQNEINRGLIGIGELYQYFRVVLMMGDQAESAMQEYRATREEIAAEDLAEDGLDEAV